LKFGFAVSMEDHREQSVHFLFFRLFLLAEHDEKKAKIANPNKVKTVIFFILIKTDNVFFIT